MLGPVFIVGPARSGTTAITRGLKAAGYAGHNEGHFLPVFEEMRRAAERWYGTRGREAQPKVLLYDNPPEVFFRRFRYIIRDYMIETYGGLHWVDKTGGRPMIEALPFFKSVFPEARIIYCKRNPYEVLTSQRIKFPELSFETHCKNLIALIQAWQAVRQKVADWVEIDQRQTLAAPADVADLFAAHLELSPPERKRFFEYIAHARPQRSSANYATLSESNVDWSDQQKAYFRSIFLETFEPR